MFDISKQNDDGGLETRNGGERPQTDDGNFEKASCVTIYEVAVTLTENCDPLFSGSDLGPSRSVIDLETCSADAHNF